MANENIKFPRANMAVRDQYFYYCDERNDTLNVRLSGGDTAFVYPFETSIGSNPVKSLEYDGNFFWTLQQGADSIDSIVKKWVIENYICKLVAVIYLNHTDEDNFSCNTFSLEYYNTTLSKSVSKHSTCIEITSNYEKIESGTILTIGPNEEGLYENVTVTGTLNNDAIFGLDFYTFNSYPSGTDVYFAKSLWLLNDYYHKQLDGGLYEVSIHNIGANEGVPILYTNYWAGSRSNMTGNWEYVLASNVYLLPGLYSTTFDAYDNDSSGEMGLRIEGPELIDVLATNTGGDSWVSQSGDFNIVTAGYYDIKGRQMVDSGWFWGVSNVSIEASIISKKNYVIGNVLQDEDYKSVIASCFYDTGVEQYILYVVGTTLRFFNINNKLNEMSLLMDNRRTDNTLIPIQDIRIEGDTLYRLQLGASYYGADYSWSTYNYQPSTLRSFIDSVTIDVNPKILPSNGINVAEITVSVRDQYNNPSQYKPVILEDSDDVGFITLSKPYTNLLGVATSYYKAGVVPDVVTLTVIITQYD